MRATLVAVALVSATVAPASAQPAFGPSEVVLPPQQLPLKFSHRQHLGFKLACDFCHDKAESSLASSDNLIPGEDTCRTCHKIDRNDPNKVAKPAARCDACHVGSDPKNPERVVIPPPNLKFNHKVHADRKIPCQKCHGSMADVDLATRAQLPRMPLCLGCHTSIPVEKKTGQRAPARCVTCHLARHDGTLETQFPTGVLSPSGTLKGDQHNARFVLDHARVASENEAYCQSCHRRDFCLSCHNGVTRPMSIHGNDYVSLHAVDSRKATTNCQGCHRLQTFCLGCHERVGVVDPKTLDQPGNLSTLNKRFHPPTAVWVSAPRTPDHHSWQAERNVRQCVSCHREDSCMECHSSKTRKGQGQIYSVSPHPTGFGSSRTCQTITARNPRVCLKCHAPGDPHLVCR